MFRTVVCLLLAAPAGAADPAAERGKQALTGTAFIKAFWPRHGYENAWRVWGLKQKPADYEASPEPAQGSADHASNLADSGSGEKTPTPCELVAASRTAWVSCGRCWRPGPYSSMKTGTLAASPR